MMYCNAFVHGFRFIVGAFDAGSVPSDIPTLRCVSGVPHVPGVPDRRGVPGVMDVPSVSCVLGVCQACHM
jgi:hypothetical protein